MRFSVLSSGSKANSTFIEAGSKRFLIDCGLSARQTVLRLGKIGINAETLDAILITHEHSDHIGGVSVMSRKFRLPVYANKKTAAFIENVFDLQIFRTSSKFEFEDVVVNSFSTVHDVVDPVGYIIESEGIKFVQATDIGKVTPLMRHAVRGANVMVIESNHDEQMLRDCRYPWELKQRIASTHGHLSNAGCAELIAESIHPGLTHVVLAHLSENSNCPEAALKTMREYLDIQQFETFICASVEEPTPLIEVIAGQSKLAI
jgi:phosphoribosyl 1,2-cyclic phosphodiesterase